MSAAGGSGAANCPSCGRRVSLAADNPYRPFCSARCRLVDFGAWVSGERRIPGPDAARDDGAADPGERH